MSPTQISSLAAILAEQELEERKARKALRKLVEVGPPIGSGVTKEYWRDTAMGFSYARALAAHAPRRPARPSTRSVGGVRQREGGPSALSRRGWNEAAMAVVPPRGNDLGEESMRRWLSIYGLGLNSVGILLLCTFGTPFRIPSSVIVAEQIDLGVGYLGIGLVVLGTVLQMMGVPKPRIRLY
jgi:hypothetical protein